MPFSIIIALAAILLVAALCVGIARWQKPGGKAITIIAGVLLLLLVVFVVCVLLLAWSANHGAPMWRSLHENQQEETNFLSPGSVARPVLTLFLQVAPRGIGDWTLVARRQGVRMKKLLPLVAGFFAGIAFAAWLNHADVGSPGLRAFLDYLATPCKLLTDRLVNLLAPTLLGGFGYVWLGLGVWYLYWACLGGLLGLLLPRCCRLLIFSVRKFRHQSTL
jgi:hypothetical protein